MPYNHRTISSNDMATFRTIVEQAPESWELVSVMRDPYYPHELVAFFKEPQALGENGLPVGKVG